MGDSSTARASGISTDSYIGSLISLTSKCEIRYEGILYKINTEESSIGLRNVRSFGTEGRKKDGPQIPPSDKIYEYILFRGTDIKDLQVKSSPPVQPVPPIHNDPAIIQSHYSHPTTTSTSTSSASSGSLVDLSSHGSHLVSPAFQGGLPLYQPGGTVGSWGSSPPPPNANGSGLALPMYWQGFYGPSNGLAHLQQQPMPFRPPGLAIPPTMQQHFPYSGLGAPSLTSSTSPPELSNPIHPPSSSASSTSISLPSTLAPSQAAALASETSSSLISNKTSLASLSAAGASVNLPLASSLPLVSHEISAIVTPLPTKPRPVRPSTLPYQNVSQSVSSIMGPSSSMLSETSVPPLITPEHILQPVTSVSASNQLFDAVQMDVEVVTSSSVSATAPILAKESPAMVSTDAKGPILPLPKLSGQKINGTLRVSSVSDRGWERGRGRGGRGTGRSTTQFTEEFDFMAMNEKFNKDEVWGHLGKTQAQHRDLEEDDLDIEETEDNAHVTRIEPVYVKDDFFDSLSCDALDQGSHSNRTKFSEQMKIDSETFGAFSRHRGGRGGRGAGRRGSFRGSYYGGRGYGYGGRGRGRGQMVSARGQ